MTLNGNMVQLPTSVIIPMRDKFRLTCIIRKVITIAYYAESRNFMVCFG